MWDIAVPVIIGVALVLVIGMMFARLYRRSTRDEAYVRTGLGGQKVVLDGGSIVLPVFHSTAAVNLKTLRLEVARGGPDSLITKDRMRVDIGAEFYLRVKPDMSSIALAAQTLGNRTNDAAELRELIEAKFVDGLRSVAATMNLEELQEQRAIFVKSVQDAVGADIQNNGLELESVSLTRLDQSDIKHFNPTNYFDAHGLTTLTKITKEREQERNQIVRTTEVTIAQQDLVARQTTLTIDSTKREAELAQQRDIANKTAAMRAETAKVEQTAVQNEAESSRSWRSPTSRLRPTNCVTPERSKPISRSNDEPLKWNANSRSWRRRPRSSSPPKAKSNPKLRRLPRPRELSPFRPKKRSLPRGRPRSPSATRSLT
jgi:flotillin